MDFCILVQCTRCNKINNSCKSLAQQIIQAHKSKRQITYTPKLSSAAFRNQVETPLTVGMSLDCYRTSRSKRLIDLMAKSGVGILYQATAKCVTQIACAVQKNISDNNGTYIPPGLRSNTPLRAAIDNIDAKVDTPDGKSSFHALASTVISDIRWNSRNNGTTN